MITGKFIKDVSEKLSKHILSFDNTFSEQETRIGAMEGGQKCFYFNHMNKATKNHIIVNGKGSASSGVRDVNMLLSAVHSEFEGSKNPANETFCRTSDGWVVGRKANERELFLHDEHKNHSLTEVDESLRILMETQFGNIFIE